MIFKIKKKIKIRKIINENIKIKLQINMIFIIIIINTKENKNN